MNILPKKRWHVRTKENVMRVRKDERKAEEEKKAEEARQALAAQEARTRLLRARATDRESLLDPFASAPAAEAEGEAEAGPSRPDVDISDPSGHLNFFADLERQERTFGGNKDAKAEAEKERCDWEKKVGILVGVADGATETLGQKDMPWWNKPRPKPKADPPKAPREVPLPPATPSQPLFPSDLEPQGSSTSSSLKRKRPKKEKKVKREKKPKKEKRKKPKRRRSPSSESSESSEEEAKRPRADLAALRAERRTREAAERAKTEALFRKMRGEKEPEAKAEPPLAESADRRPRKQQYNSQFNPDAARQNIIQEER